MYGEGTIVSKKSLPPAFAAPQNFKLGGIVENRVEEIFE